MNQQRPLHVFTAALAALLFAAAVESQAAPAENADRSERQTFQQFAAINDADGDGVVTREEFRGQGEQYDGIDINRDGRITIADFTDAPPPLESARQAPVEEWILENAAIRVALGQDGGIALREIAGGIAWEPVVPPDANAQIGDVTVSPDKRSLRARLNLDNLDWTLGLQLVGDEPEVKLTMDAPAHKSMAENVFYPFALRAPSGQYRAVVPHKTGLMYEVKDAYMPKVQGRYDNYAETGLAMPWYGVTDLKNGLMAVFDTPDDAGVEIRLAKPGQDEVFALMPYWRSSMSRVNYDRAMTLRLFADGGYVAMCKNYRRRLINGGQFVSLRQKAVTHPQLAQLIGAIDLYLWRINDDDTRSIVEYFEQNGMERMLINSEASPAVTHWIRDRGHLLGVYTIFTGGPRTNSDAIVPPDENGHTTASRTGGFGGPPAAAPTRAEDQTGTSTLARFRPPAEATASEPPQGQPQGRRGGRLGGEAQDAGENSRSYIGPDGQPLGRGGICSLFHLPPMANLLRPFVDEYGYQTLFFDVVTASQLRECYSPAHGLDRTGDKTMKKAVLEYANRMGVLVASEDGNDYACPVAHYFEGLQMPRRFGYLPGTTVRNYNEKFDLTDEYKNVDLNERIRTPLWDLVFHDSVISSWRWNFPPDRYTDASYWDKHDLFNVINASMPIFLVDGPLIEANGQRYVQTYKTVCDWSVKVGWDELIDHRALNDDRSVQESRFANGWAVVVNFSPDTPFAWKDGETIAPYSAHEYRWKE